MGAIARGAAICAGVICVLHALVLPGRLSAASLERHVSNSDWGGVGLLQTRTARFGPDGQLDFGASFVFPYRRYYLNLHVWPWLETTFRYTDIRNRLFSDDELFSGFQTFKDRGADLKVKLFAERKYLPAIAVGLQDGLGTGLFSGEYIVASKRYYDLDFSFGLAWGNPGSRGLWKNPLTFLSDRFKSRGEASAGRPALGAYFSGERISPFFGVEYHTPIKGLTVKLEFDGNDYQREPLKNRFDLETDLKNPFEFETDLPINFGINYRPVSWFETSVGLERGNTFMFRLALRSDLNQPGAPKIFDPPPKPVGPRPGSEAATPAPAPAPRPPESEGTPATVLAATLELEGLGRDRGAGLPVAAPIDGGTAAVDRLFDGLEAEGFEVASIDLSHSEVRVYLSRGRVADDSLAVARAAELVAETVPTPVEKITLIGQDANGEQKTVTLGRNDVEETAIVDYLFDGLEAEGFEVERLDLSHREARVYVSRGPRGAGDVADRRAARLVLSAVPTPIEQVTIISVAAGVERERASLRRDEVKQSAFADNLFDDLEAAGFDVDSVDFSHRKATVYVAATAMLGETDYRTAAETVSQAVPESMDEIVVVGMRAGVEVRRWTLRRGVSGGAMGAASEQNIAAEAGPDRHAMNLAMNVASAAPSGEVAPTIDTEQLFKDLSGEGFKADALHLTARRATVYVAPKRYPEAARNIGRAARIVANYAPAPVEEISVVTMSRGMELSQVTIMRKDLERALASQGSTEELWAKAIVGPAEGGIPRDAIRNPDRYPSFSWSFRPAVTQHIGGPEGFFLYELYAALSGSAELIKGLSAGASLGFNIVDTFDRLEPADTSKLPPVRSDIRNYLQEGRNRIRNLHISYLFSPLPEWYARISAGIFERMFGGVGAEVLYRPFESRWAIGLEVNRVRQRDFEQLFGFQDYEVTTGHLGLYYQMPWYNLLGTIHIGQYLAGDRGATFRLSRRFKSGIRAGAWVTFTDVPFAKFGEGSFDKGFFLSIPFNVFLLRSTRSSATFGFRPLTRDGGQMVNVPARLYGVTQDGGLGAIARFWPNFLD